MKVQHSIWKHRYFDAYFKVFSAQASHFQLDPKRRSWMWLTSGYMAITGDPSDHAGKSLSVYALYAVVFTHVSHIMCHVSHSVPISLQDYPVWIFVLHHLSRCNAVMCLFLHLMITCIYYSWVRCVVQLISSCVNIQVVLPVVSKGN